MENSNTKGGLWIKHKENWIFVDDSTTCADLGIENIYLHSHSIENKVGSKKYTKVSTAIQDATNKACKHKDDNIICLCSNTRDEISKNGNVLLYITKKNDVLEFQNSDGISLVKILDISKCPTVECRHIKTQDKILKNNIPIVWIRTHTNQREIGQMEKYLKSKFNIKNITYETILKINEKKEFLSTIDFYLSIIATKIDMYKLPPINILYLDELVEKNADYNPLNNTIRLKKGHLTSIVHEYGHHIDYSRLRSDLDIEDATFTLVENLKNSSSLMTFIGRYNQVFLHYKSIVNKSKEQHETNRLNQATYEYYLKNEEIFARFFADWIIVRNYKTVPSYNRSFLIKDIMTYSCDILKILSDIGVLK